MSSSMTGSTGMPGVSTASKMRGVDPRMKHISGHHRVQQFTPEAMDLYQSLFSQLDPESFLSRLAGGDEEIFRQVEQPALKQFAGLQGGLASRFSGGNPFGGQPGGMSARRSSGFQNTMNQAASDFAQQLQSQRMGLQRQALQDLMGYSQMLMGQEPYALQKRGSSSGGIDWGSLIGKLGGGAIGGILGGPLGSSIGSSFGSMFSSNPSVPNTMEMGFRSGAPGYY